MMTTEGSRLQRVLRHPVRFFLGAVADFRANQGFLLSGAVAYYTLLSIVPIFALILVGLSHVVDKESLLETMATYLEMVVPAQSGAILAQITMFLQQWRLVGVVGFIILLFFSSLAFTTLENAMSIIFHHRVAIRRRHFLFSAVLPYVYIFMLGLGLFIVSIMSGTLHSIDQWSLTVMGHTWSLHGSYAVAIYLLGLLGEIMLLTSLYMVMPVGRLKIAHALIGGVTAALLWELTRHLLVWYFATLSIVNVVYGSLGSAIIILLSFEIGALILLFGAQVIAAYEQDDSQAHRRDGFRT